MKLDEVVRKLEQNANIARIKKLIYFTCYGSWESDTQIIGSLSVRELVESLLSLNLSIPELRIVLNNIVQKLNKSHEYSKVANAIISEVVKLYPDEEDSTHPMLMYDPMEDATKPESPLEEVEQLLAGESRGADRKVVPEKDEWFDARLKMMQKTTPLRAKILIFSTLYHEFTFGERDWSLLKKKGLSDLLRKLSLACPNIEDLEKKLAIPAKKLPGSSDYLQAAKAIAKYMTPYYENDEDGKVEEKPEEELREAREEPVPAANDRYELAIGNDTQSSQISPVHPRDANNNENSKSWSNNENSKSWSIPTVPVPQLANNSRSRSPVAEDSTYLDEASTTNSNRLSSSGSARRLKITDVLKQKRELEADIQALVDQSVDPVMTIIENTLTDLEKVLDDRLQGQEVGDRVSRKYQALKDWVTIAGDALAKYMEVLNQMEQSDIEDLSREAKAQAEPPEPKTNGGSRPDSQADSQADSQLQEKTNTTPIVDTDRQQKIMELAKQGNPKAIAALLNQSLKSRGMTAIALLKEEFLHIILESDQEPNRQKTAKFASKTLRELNLTSITAAKVHWRKPGKKSPDWSQELEISPIE